MSEDRLVRPLSLTLKGPGKSEETTLLKPKKERMVELTLPCVEITISIDGTAMKIYSIDIKIDEMTINIADVAMKIDEITIRVDEITPKNNNNKNQKHSNQSRWKANEEQRTQIDIEMQQ